MKRIVVFGAITVLCTLASAGCSNRTGGFGPLLRLSYSVEGWSASPPPELHIAIDGQRIVLAAAAPGSSSGSSREIRGIRYGDVPLRVALMATSDDTLASIELTHRLERDRAHWVAAVVGTRRPLGFCIGKLDAVPLRRSGPDTMFVMTGSIPEDAVC